MDAVLTVRSPSPDDGIIVITFKSICNTVHTRNDSRRAMSHRTLPGQLKIDGVYTLYTIP